MSGISISTVNVNGIRAAYKKGFIDWLNNAGHDIICLQEVRAQEDQIPDPVLELPYHLILHTGERKGYAGVGILSKTEPLNVIHGIGSDWADEEGRVLMAEFDNYRICSVYAPSGTTGDVRQDLKMEFLELFDSYSAQYIKDTKPTIFCGDFNICHTEIDIHNPIQNKNTSGFLPEEREWIGSFIDKGFNDVFRDLNPNLLDAYSWWSYRAGAKKNNKGWRIDYQLANVQAADIAMKAVIEHETAFSDHAPVSVVYDFD
jgi:exodeoxyribonuclease-3